MLPRQLCAPGGVLSAQFMFLSELFSCRGIELKAGLRRAASIIDTNILSAIFLFRLSAVVERALERDTRRRQRDCTTPSSIHDLETLGRALHGRTGAGVAAHIKTRGERNERRSPHSFAYSRMQSLRVRRLLKTHLTYAATGAHDWRATAERKRGRKATIDLFRTTRQAKNAGLEVQERREWGACC